MTKKHLLISLNWKRSPHKYHIPSRNDCGWLSYLVVVLLVGKVHTLKFWCLYVCPLGITFTWSWLFHAHSGCCAHWWFSHLVVILTYVLYVCLRSYTVLELSYPLAELPVTHSAHVGSPGDRTFGVTLAGQMLLPTESFRGLLIIFD